MREKSFWIYFFAMFLACLKISGTLFYVNYEFASLPYIVGVLVVYLFVTVVHRKKVNKNDKFILIFISISIVKICFKMFFYGNTFILTSVLAVGCFIILASFLFFDNSINYRVLCYLSGIGSVVLLVATRINLNVNWGVVYVGEMGAQGIGMWALVYALYAVISMDYIIQIRCRLFKVLAFLEVMVFVGMLYISWISEARFSVVLILGMLLFRVLPPLKIVNNKIFRILLVISPALVIMASFFLQSIGVGISALGGTLLNRREEIWRNILVNVSDNPFWGLNYNVINPNTFYSHNILIDYYALFGMFVVLSFVFIIMYFCVFKVPLFNKREMHSRVKYDAFLAFGLLIFASSIEGSVFSIGTGGMFIFSFSFLLISISKDAL